jgi:hypothetical protein
MILESVAAFTLLAGANYADYSTTRAAIARGGVEANPIFGRGAERLAPIKAAVVATETFGFYKIRKKHKVLAWVYVGAVVGVNVAIARHNSQVLKGAAR